MMPYLTPSAYYWDDQNRFVNARSGELCVDVSALLREGVNLRKVTDVFPSIGEYFFPDLGGCPPEPLALIYERLNHIESRLCFLNARHYPQFGSASGLTQNLNSRLDCKIQLGVTEAFFLVVFCYWTIQTDLSRCERRAQQAFVRKGIRAIACRLKFLHPDIDAAFGLWGIKMSDLHRLIPSPESDRHQN